MSTLANIKNQADLIGEPLVDNDTPEGHFLITVRLLGVTMTYLLDGNNNEAQILGRIEYPPTGSLGSALPNAYRGNNLRGGTLLTRTGDISSAALFARMI